MQSYATKNADKTAIVLGSGMAGCIAAYFLRRKGWKVTVIEKAPVVGGGNRTLFHGGHPYTFGPHHFLTPYKEAWDFIRELIPMREIDQLLLSYVSSDSEFYSYPIHEDDIPLMPEKDTILAELAARPDNAKVENFEEHWIARVGETLYKKFINDYSRKMWQIESNTALDFGFTDSVKGTPLKSGDRYVWRDRINAYPANHDGYNAFFDIALEGCEVRVKSFGTAYDMDNRKITMNNGDVLQADIIVSTVSPDIIMNSCYGPLRYIGREFLPIVLPIEHVFPKDVHFVYYTGPNERHTRIVEYKKLTLHKSPHTLLGVEIPVLGKNPLYPLTTKVDVEHAQKYIDNLPPNVFSIGRMGTYRYIDLDDIIMSGIEFAKQF